MNIWDIRPVPPQPSHITIQQPTPQLQTPRTRTSTATPTNSLLTPSSEATKTTTSGLPEQLSQTAPTGNTHHNADNVRRHPAAQTTPNPSRTPHQHIPANNPRFLADLGNFCCHACFPPGRTNKLSSPPPERFLPIRTIRANRSGDTPQNRADPASFAPAARNPSTNPDTRTARSRNSRATSLGHNPYSATSRHNPSRRPSHVRSFQQVPYPNPVAAGLPDWGGGALILTIPCGVGGIRKAFQQNQCE